MISSLSPEELADYVAAQANHFFPDRHALHSRDLVSGVCEALDRLAYCFAAARSERYREGAQARFQHLYSDHYLMFLWWLSRVIHLNSGSDATCNKLYCLNKALHAFDSIYSNALPDRFLVIHGVGTVLGRAQYGEYFVAHQGCTVGQNRGQYPRMGMGVGLGAGAAVLGGARIGSEASIGAGVTVVGGEVGDRAAVWRSREGALSQTTGHSRPIAREYFDFPQ